MEADIKIRRPMVTRCLFFFVLLFILSQTTWGDDCASCGSGQNLDGVNVRSIDIEKIVSHISDDNCFTKISYKELYVIALMSAEFSAFKKEHPDAAFATLEKELGKIIERHIHELNASTIDALVAANMKQNIENFAQELSVNSTLQKSYLNYEQELKSF